MPNDHSNTPSNGQQPQTIPLSKIRDLPGVFNPKPVKGKLGSMIISIQNSSQSSCASTTMANISFWLATAVSPANAP